MKHIIMTCTLVLVGAAHAAQPHPLKPWTWDNDTISKSMFYLNALTLAPEVMDAHPTTRSHFDLTPKKLDNIVVLQNFGSLLAAGLGLCQIARKEPHKREWLEIGSFSLNGLSKLNRLYNWYTH